MFRFPSRVYLYAIGGVVAIYRNIISSGEETATVDDKPRLGIVEEMRAE